MQKEINQVNNRNTKKKYSSKGRRIEGKQDIKEKENL